MTRNVVRIVDQPIPTLGYGDFQWWLADLPDQPPRKPTGTYLPGATRTQNGATRYRFYIHRVRLFDPNKVPRDPKGKLHKLYGHDHYSKTEAVGEIMTMLDHFRRSYLGNDQEADFDSTVTLFWDWFGENASYEDIYDMADGLLKRYQHPQLGN